MPPGQVSRGQGGTGLRFLTRSSSLWRKDKSHVDNSDSKSSPSDSSANGNGNGSHGSGNKPGSDNSSNGSSSGSSSTPVFPPPPPPCFFPCVPDNDPRVSYSASWSLSPTGFFQTSHHTDVIGSSLSFSFNGTGITVFGSVPPSNATHGPPTAAYSVDGGVPVPTAEAMATTIIPNQPLFSMSGLSAGVHSLVINVTDVQPASPFSIDYFIVKPAAPPPSSPSPTASPSASVIAPEKVVTSGTASKNTHSPATMGILAGVLGAVIFTLLCVLVFFLVILRRRRQQALRSKSMQSSLFTTPESILMYSRAPSSYYASKANPWRNKQPSLSEKSHRTMTSYGLNTHGQ